MQGATVQGQASWVLLAVPAQQGKRNWWKKVMRPEHRWAWNNLSAYMDGELSPADATRVEKHLKKCARCRRELDSLCQLTDLLRQVPPKPVPRSFFVSEQMVTERRRSRARSWTYGALRTASVLATLLLVFVVGGDLLLFGGQGLLSGFGLPGMAPAFERPVAVERAVQAVTPLAEEAPVSGTPSQGLIAREPATEAARAKAPALGQTPGLAEAPERARPESRAGENVAGAAPQAAQPTESPSPSSGAAITPTVSPEAKALALAQPTTAPTEAPAPQQAARGGGSDLVVLRRLRSIELALLGTVVILITVTLLLRRTMRHS